MYSKKFIASLLTALFVLCTPSYCFAIENNRIGAHPQLLQGESIASRSWFIYQMKEGDSYTDALTVVNNSSEQIGLKLYPVDSTSTQEGVFALKGEGEPREDVGQWIKLAKEHVRLKSKSIENIPFTVKIPAGIEVGDHSGGIIIQQERQDNISSKNIGINIIHRLGLRMYITVPGIKKYALSILKLGYDLSKENISFDLHLRNDGNVHIKPSGRLELHGMIYKKSEYVDIGPLELNSFNKAIINHVNTGVKKPWFEVYVARLSLVFGNNQMESKETSFVVYDWRIIALVGGYIAAGYLLILYWHFKHRARWYNRR